jgi:hypothetical protein
MFGVVPPHTHVFVWCAKLRTEAKEPFKDVDCNLSTQPLWKDVTVSDFYVFCRHF